jgi:predicted dehydrogenase
MTAANSPLRYAVIGCGYWGPNLIRNLHGMENATITWACDLDPSRLQRMNRLYPGLPTTTNHEDVMRAGDVDVVVLATPTHTHHALGMQALAAGKHLLVEKPLASSRKEAASLLEAARAKSLVVGVDHTFLYGGAVRKIKELLDREELGDLYYIDSVRVNLGLFQADINVLWDLAPHDLAIIDYLRNGEMPVSVSAHGATHVGKQENVVYLAMRYASGFVAHVNANWLAPVKIRQMLIGGSKKMIVYDDVVASEKVQVFDRGAEIRTKEEMYGALVEYRSGDMWAPKLSGEEALAVELREFTNHVLHGAPFASDGEAGLRIVSLLEAADRSMKSGGAPVDL